ncbi:hypothetical protein [Pseudoduganella albidiflava]|uniref:KOW domain-containing protein n=1 Tax=Pseudoduganella albidiflava TaxID=321983 RepID=A0A411X364_9BURK|nr:hypothetical protein [Pseudoduganella albidiflava]QBI03305.1 hypothetical protein EYF70_22610 [Pseudoduganella albidiflava]GGY67865.1 hypothetical protein GCM10007387_57560 [Pseudoduganella albidiflava]
MQNKKIGPGSPVTFESDAGPQHGTVAEIKTDVTNGAKIASVRVPGTMGGAPWTMPVNELSHAEAA